MCLNTNKTEKHNLKFDRHLLLIRYCDLLHFRNMANIKNEQDTEIENVRVFIRVRPLNKKELTEGNQNIVLLDPKENLIVLKKNEDSTKPFKFDYIFNENAAQVSIILLFILVMHSIIA